MKFDKMIEALEKKKEFTIPVIHENSEIDKQYQKLVKNGFLKQPKKEFIQGVEYLVYKRTKKAEKYFQKSAKKKDKMN